MTLFINGYDFSDYIQQKTDISENPRYVKGMNEKVALNGSTMFDRLATKYDAAFKLKPMPASKIRELIRICEQNEVSVEYTSVLFDETRSITAQCSIGAISYLTTQNGERIYGECSIVVVEK